MNKKLKNKIKKARRLANVARKIEGAETAEMTSSTIYADEKKTIDEALRRAGIDEDYIAHKLQEAIEADIVVTYRGTARPQKGVKDMGTRIKALNLLADIRGDKKQIHEITDSRERRKDKVLEALGLIVDDPREIDGS